jgi:hypothetical protein
MQLGDKSFDISKPLCYWNRLVRTLIAFGFSLFVVSFHPFAWSAQTKHSRPHVQFGFGNPLALILQSSHPAISNVMQNLSRHELQIAFSQINRNGEKVDFVDHFYQVDVQKYFYPASTVKMIAAVLATEFIASQPQLDLTSTYFLEGDPEPHSLADDIRQIFAVSDNQAFNRLYELLGRDYMNRRLVALGFMNTRIAHRLDADQPDRAIRQPIVFDVSGGTQQGKLQFDNDADQPIASVTLRNQQKGIGFIQLEKLLDQPFDFSKKNYFSILDQHNFIRRLIFPDQFSAANQFQLRPRDRAYLIDAMHTVPRKAGYDESEFYDSYAKFFVVGDDRSQFSETLKICNKVGYAYGTLSDTAYIVDQEAGVEFILSATILVNDNQIFNDDEYQYHEIGIPFLAQLGRAILEYERARKLN